MPSVELSSSHVVRLGLALVPAATVFGMAARQGIVALNDDEPRYSVAGRLLVDGSPVGGAEIRFHSLPVQHWTSPAWAMTDENGRFRVRSNAWQHGVPAGEYRVTIAWHAPVIRGEDYLPGPNVLPARYAQPELTPLRVTVRPGDNSLDTWNLRRCDCSG